MEASHKYLSLSPSTGVFFLSLTGQARTAILEMGISQLNAEDGMDKLVEKLDTLFLEDKNQSGFICYKNFKNYHRECNTSINDYLIQFDRHVAKLRKFQITLPEPVLAYRALKSAILSPENERLIRATINNLTLYDINPDKHLTAAIYFCQKRNGHRL